MQQCGGLCGQNQAACCTVGQRGQQAAGAAACPAPGLDPGPSNHCTPWQSLPQAVQAPGHHYLRQLQVQHRAQAQQQRGEVLGRVAAQQAWQRSRRRVSVRPPRERRGTVLRLQLQARHTQPHHHSTTTAHFYTSLAHPPYAQPASRQAPDQPSCHPACVQVLTTTSCTPAKHPPAHPHLQRWASTSCTTARR